MKATEGPSIPADAWRCFVALPVPEAMARRIETALTHLRERHQSVRWIPARHLHLTLVFLGSVSPDLVGDVGEAMRTVAARHDHFELALGGGSGLARRDDDGVAWLTVKAGHMSIVRLADDLRRQLGELPILRRALRGPATRWRPHLTVARHASISLISALKATSLPAEPIAWRAQSMVLFRSHLGPPGARYE